MADLVVNRWWILQFFPKIYLYLIPSTVFKPRTRFNGVQKMMGAQAGLAQIKGVVTQYNTI